MSSTYVTFTKVAHHHKVKNWKLNGQYHYIEFENGSRIDLLDVKKNPSDPMFERFGSTEYTGGVLEEAGEIDFLAFDVLKSRVGRHLNKEYNMRPKILITCNPKKNWLYQYVYKPHTEGTLEKDFAFIQSLYNDNPYTAESYQEQLSSIKDKTMKERLMYGNWEYDNDPNALFEYDSLTDLFTNTVDEHKDKFMTVDVARFGSDKSVITIWKGFECEEIKMYQKTSLDYLADEIRAVARDRQIPFSKIIVDEDGVGGGIVDMVRGVKGFMANRTPFLNRFTGKPDNFRNLKTQCYYALADYVNSRKLAIRTEDESIRSNLIEELEQVKSKDGLYDSKLQLEGKDVMKEMLGRSPDLADAVMMRMYFELDNPLHTAEKLDPIAVMLAKQEMLNQGTVSNTWL